MTAENKNSNGLPFHKPFILQGPIGRGKEYRQNKVVAIPSPNAPDLVTIIKLTVGGSLIHFDINPDEAEKLDDDTYKIHNAPQKFGDCKAYLSAQNYQQIHTKLSAPYKK